MDEYLERESKLEVDENFVLSTFEDVAPSTRVLQSTIELTSTYWDTADRDLLAHGVTLRRREGDDDNGWQLKLPAPDGRTEVRTEPEDSVPAELAALTRGVRLDKNLEVVATIRTTRDRYRIHTDADELWAEVADDDVRVSLATFPDEVMQWREIEVEAGSDTADISPIVDRLRRDGATVAEHSSKLDRALGHNEPRDAGPLERYLHTQIDKIFAGDIGLRRHLDPIHATRVAIRRLRSSLRVYEKLLDPAQIGDVGVDLKCFAGALGGVRDCHVQRRRISSAIAHLDPEFVVGSIGLDVDDILAERQDAARREITEAMDSARYFALLAKLHLWTTDPPVAGVLSDRDLRKQRRRAARKADKRLAEGLSTGRGEDLHRARKAAKRARYAAELTGTKKVAKRYKRIQKVLGEHQDSVVAADTLLDIAHNHSAELNAFTLGVLYARERRLAARARRAVAEL